jgi:hypothetical protein
MWCFMGENEDDLRTVHKQTYWECLRKENFWKVNIFFGVKWSKLSLPSPWWLVVESLTLAQDWGWRVSRIPFPASLLQEKRPLFPILERDWVGPGTGWFGKEKSPSPLLETELRFHSFPACNLATLWATLSRPHFFGVTTRTNQLFVMHCLALRPWIHWERFCLLDGMT